MLKSRLKKQLDKEDVVMPAALSQVLVTEILALSLTSLCSHPASHQSANTEGSAFKTHPELDPVFPLLLPSSLSQLSTSPFLLHLLLLCGLINTTKLDHVTPLLTLLPQ